MSLSAVTVLGADRPGVIAEVTSAITRSGANIEDSAMTLLGGHVAMMLLVSGEVPPASAFPGLTVTATEVTSRRPPGGDAPGLGYVLTAHGPDRPGIVSEISGALAAASGVITGMTTRLCGRLYVLIADVRLPEAVDVAALMRHLSAVCAGLGCEITFRPAEAEVL
ncbi:glycine cleavage system protein R [Planobispora longispora]|uniref:Amino acid-binding protein n=1 Tax=Planobispora longispora TaxID=28887 RepID=A0A8J3RNA1_9ACTN|nr:ACT domain-containing protein [Planobispora longispora]BFE83657.1 amino acid-binding protein [Planobispora longispora]GIH77241.1 amino acid-binding protein [Planobispora longispora]